MSKTLQCLTIALFALTLTACQSLPNKREYTLSPEIKMDAPSRNPQTSIAISVVKTSNPALHSKQMEYSRSKNEVEYYTKSEWAAPPSKLIQQVFTKALTESNRYRDIIQLPSDLKSTLRLDLHILTMRQFFDNQQSNHVEISLQARLINSTTHHVYYSKTYRETELGLEHNAKAGVEAYNRALERLIPKVLNDIRRYHR